MAQMLILHLRESYRVCALNRIFSCLLELGTCGLHTVHRAFQTGAKETGWNLDKFFLKEYKLFKDSPARREDYVKYTGVDIFPCKFCNHR